jgi:hypothetical protein
MKLKYLYQMHNHASQVTDLFDTLLVFVPVSTPISFPPQKSH